MNVSQEPPLRSIGQIASSIGSRCAEVTNRNALVGAVSISCTLAARRLKLSVVSPRTPKKAERSESRSTPVMRYNCPRRSKPD